MTTSTQPLLPAYHTPRRREYLSTPRAAAFPSPRVTDIATFSELLGRPLRPYQLEPALAILESIIQNQGHTIAVMMSRQAGKNELSAQIEAFLLAHYRARGGQIVKAAPTFQPQVLTSLQRLESTLAAIGATGQFRREHGHQVALGRARCLFYSAEPTANVVGATASLALELDEAQDITPDKHDKDFAPMASASNATRVFYGTAWDDQTLLARVIAANTELEQRDHIRRNFIVPWDIVAEHLPAHGTYVQSERDRLGADHPLFRTQYLLEPITGESGLFDTRQRALLQGDHPPLAHPSEDWSPAEEPIYVAGIDIAGPDEDAADAALRQLKPRKDSTVITIARLTRRPAISAPTPEHADLANYEHAVEQVLDRHQHAESVPPAHVGNVSDWQHRLESVPPSRAGKGARGLGNPVPYADDVPALPHLHIVAHYWWTGHSHRSQLEAILHLLRDTWHCRRIAVDASGLGAGIADLLKYELGSAIVEPVVFTAATKSRLAFALLAAINSSHLKMYRAATDESAEFWRQITHARYAVRAHQQLTFYVPESEGHDDFLSSLALTVHAAATAKPPAFSVIIPPRPDPYERSRY